MTSRRDLPSSNDAITCSGAILLSAILFPPEINWLIECLYAGLAALRNRFKRTPAYCVGQISDSGRALSARVKVTDAACFLYREHRLGAGYERDRRSLDDGLCCGARRLASRLHGHASSGGVCRASDVPGVFRMAVDRRDAPAFQNQ